MSTIVGSIPWGLDSETGVLRHVLLGKPDYFEWRPVSAVARQTLSLGLHFDAQVAMSQHREMVDVYERAGVACHWLDARPELKYGVFARELERHDAIRPGYHHATDALPTRRLCADDQILSGRRHSDLEHDHRRTFRGRRLHGGRAGLCLMRLRRRALRKEGAEQMCDWFRAEDWEAYPVPFPPHFVHLDVSVGFINEKLVAVAQDAHQPWFLDLLKSKGYEILPISYYNSTQLGANIVSLGDDRVLSTAANKDLNARMRALGIEVYIRICRCSRWAAAALIAFARLLSGTRYNHGEGQRG